MISMSGEYRLEKGEKGVGGRERGRKRAREIERERENVMYLKINFGAGNFSLPYTHISDTLGYG